MSCISALARLGVGQAGTMAMMMAGPHFKMWGDILTFILDTNSQIVMLVQKKCGDLSPCPPI